MNGTRLRLVRAALVLGLATVFAAACSANSDDTAGMAAEAPRQAADSGGAGEGGTGEPGAPAEQQQVSQPGVDRTLVRTATIELAADDVGRTADHARDIAVDAGGYAGQEEVRDETATITLHIPADRFDQALGDLSDLGRVISRSQAAEDATEQLVDLDSRVATQRASVDRIRALLAQAGTVEDIVRIESEVTTREADLESLEQRRVALAGQVAMSTATVRVSKDAAAPPAPAESGGFLGGLGSGWDAFLAAGGVTLQVIGAVLPFAVIVGVPVAVAARWWRRRRASTPIGQRQEAT